MQIGPYTVGNGLISAPMAGVTDLPFRSRRKTRLRLDHTGETGPRRVLEVTGAAGNCGSWRHE